MTAAADFVRLDHQFSSVRWDRKVYSLPFAIKISRLSLRFADKAV
jgi:hypothetical protein